jgi:hypothetical protein
VAEVARMMGRTPQGIVARADRLSYRVNGDGTEQYTMLQAFISTARHQRGAAAPSAIPETSEPKARYLPVAPFLLEVHTEQFYLVLHALEAAGFEVKSRPNLPSRYVVRDTENAGESV